MFVAHLKAWPQTSLFRPLENALHLAFLLSLMRPRYPFLAAQYLAPSSVVPDRFHLLLRLASSFLAMVSSSVHQAPHASMARAVKVRQPTPPPWLLKKASQPIHPSPHPAWPPGAFWLPPHGSGSSWPSWDWKRGSACVPTGTASPPRNRVCDGRCPSLLLHSTCSPCHSCLRTRG